MPRTKSLPTTVIKLGGNVVADTRALDALAAGWKAAPRGRWIIVHGGGPQLDAALAARGPALRVSGLRMTPAEDMAVVRQVLDDIGAKLTEALAARGANVVHVPSHWALLHAAPIVSPDADLGRVGAPTSFAADVFARMVPDKAIAVLCPIGWDADGPLNVNADDAAARVARDARAVRLVLATDVPAVQDGVGAPLARLDPVTARALITTKVAKAGMVPKLQAAVRAAESGVRDVVVGDVCAAWDGSGTHITAVAA
jgi:acetylglutamate kinase